MEFKVLAFFAFVVVASAFPQEQLKVLEVEELPPYKIPLVKQLCLEGDNSCDAVNEAAQKQINDQFVADVEAWISRMGPNFKSSWQQKHPEVAADYEQLKG